MKHYKSIANHPLLIQRLTYEICYLSYFCNYSPMLLLAWLCDYWAGYKQMILNRPTVSSIRTTKTAGDPSCLNQIMPTKDGGRVETGGIQKSTINQISRPQPQPAPHSESKPTHEHSQTQQITRPHQNRPDNSHGNRNSTTPTNTSKHQAAAGRAHPRSNPSPMRGG